MFHGEEGLTAVGAVLPVERLQSRRVHEEPVERGELLVSGGAGHGPVVRQLLVGPEHLLDEDRDARDPVEPVEVRRGVAQTVDVIDAQRVDVAVTCELDHERVGPSEDLGVLDAHTDEIVDVEEAAHVPLRCAPVDQRVVLDGEQVGERETRVAIGTEREAALEVTDRRLGPVDVDPQITRREHVRQRRAEDGEQHAIAAGRPVDVEDGRIRRVATVAQHVPPPSIVLVGGQVIGDDVEDDPEVALVRGLHERVERGPSAELGPHARGVDHVVPVRRAGPGLEARRQVHVRDAERVEVVDERGDGGEVEVRTQLAPMGGDERAAHGVSPASGPGPSTTA